MLSLRLHLHGNVNRFGSERYEITNYYYRFNKVRVLVLNLVNLWSSAHCTNLHDSLLNERRRVIDQDNEGLGLDELVHHLLKHKIGQEEQDAPQ